MAVSLGSIDRTLTIRWFQGLFYLGMTAKNGSGSIFTVEYTASAILQKTSSCEPLG
jgi:hypothetical protein